MTRRPMKSSVLSNTDFFKYLSFLFLEIGVYAFIIFWGVAYEEKVLSTKKKFPLLKHFYPVFER